MEDLIRRVHQVFLWSLGMREFNQRQTGDWYTGMECLVARRRSKRQERFLAITSVIFQTVLIISSLILAWSKIDCHLLGTMFTSSAIVVNLCYLLFYWPLLAISPVICIIILARTSFHRRRGIETAGRTISWVDSFGGDDEMTYDVMEGPRISQWCTFIVFYTLLLASCTLETLDSASLLPECQTWSATISIVCNLGNQFFYCNFCYFLYLKRKSLERNCERSVTFMRVQIQQHERCCSRASNVFRRYYALRRFLFPWLNLVLFCSVFGLTFFLSWKLYYPPIYPSTHSSKNGSLHFQDTLFCSEACKTAYVERHDESLIFPAKVVTEKFMMIILALHVVRGLDLKHQWDHFRMNVYLATSTVDDKEQWKQLTELLEKIHPDTNHDILASVTFPLLGLITGFLSGKNAA